MQTKKYALVSVGELLIDFIGAEIATSIIDTEKYNRFQGGSPANMAANMARLGGKVALVSCVGDDNLGKFMVAEIAKTNIDTNYIAINTDEPTSIVVVSRTKGTPDFIAYRTADKMIEANHIPDDLLANSSFFHTTCFALSKNPAQSTIVEAAQRAITFGCKVSIDCNFHPKIWPNRAEAWLVLTDYCKAGAFVKLSDDDAERLYGEVVNSEKIISDFHFMGAELVCLTLGAKGCIISYENGTKTCEILPKQIEVKDATGAGDAFWSGFLTAYIAGISIPLCGEAGSKMAAIKLAHFGPLGNFVDKALLY
jgi:sugar/nucleoside kinase (ribokinase family)